MRLAQRAFKVQGSTFGAARAIGSLLANGRVVTKVDRRSRFKAAIKREESDARISYPEREQARPKVKV